MKSYYVYFLLLDSSLIVFLSLLDLVTVLASAAIFCKADYFPSDDVVELTASNFNSKVIQSDDVWLVEFYAPWYVV